MENSELQQQLTDLNTRIGAMERVIQDVKERQDAIPALPKTNLLSGSFLTRAFAVFGHYFVANLIIVMPIFVLAFIVFLIIGITLAG